MLRQGDDREQDREDTDGHDEDDGYEDGEEDDGEYDDFFPTSRSTPTANAEDPCRSEGA